MPCILKVRIDAARNLPVMDRKTDMTDAFVELKFADFENKRTQICRKTLNPVWKEDFRFEVTEDSDLQNEPLELRIMDYDQLTYNDSIGTVFIDLNPLLNLQSGAQISGWFPIYDTLLGMRGELLAHVKLLFFGNINPFKDSSAGVQFFSSPEVPEGFTLCKVVGLVSAIDNDDDPEYHWTDSFRTPRKSNEARMRVLFQLSGQVRRVLGRRVLEQKGNAVIGYKQYIDLEEDQKSITVRAIGTAVVLSGDGSSSFAIPLASAISLLELTPNPLVPGDSNFIAADRGDLETPAVSSPALLPARVTLSKKLIDPMILTLTTIPRGSILGTGGYVSVAAIKMLENDETTVRENWWTEARTELKSHARTLHCSHVIGYSEHASIVDDVVFLYCSGTAVNLKIANLVKKHSSEKPEKAISRTVSVSLPEAPAQPSFLDSPKQVDEPERQSAPRDCASCHITYPKHESPFPMDLLKCDCCGKKYVPEVLLSTTEPPSELQLIGKPVLIEAHVCRPRKLKVGDTIGNNVSDAIPFMQYDIHRQLTYKLRVYGLNAIFGLKIQISAGENIMTAVATGTAVYVRALPTPPALKLRRNLEVVDEEDRQLYETQNKLMTNSEINRNKIKEILEESREADLIDRDLYSSGASSSEDELEPLEVPKSRLEQRAMIIDIDDEKDEDLVLFLDDVWSETFQMSSIEFPNFNKPIADSNFQMITMVKQADIDVSHHPNRHLAKLFKSMYQELMCQMSYLSPATVTGLRYAVQLPRASTVQVYLVGMVGGNAREEAIDLSIDLDFFDRYSNSRASASGVNINFPRIQSVMPSFNNSARHSISYTEPEKFTNPAAPEMDAESISSTSDKKTNEELQDTEIPHNDDNSIEDLFETNPVELCSVSQIPGALSLEYLGRISLHFIKETALTYDSFMGSSGLGGFAHAFMMEVMAVVKSHVLCLKGNAVVNFSVDRIVISESMKNLGYAMITVSGDVVLAKY